MLNKSFLMNVYIRKTHLSARQKTASSRKQQAEYNRKARKIMIRITSFKAMNARKNIEGYDEVWAIVRSLKYPSPKLIQTVSLAPSMELFNDYLSIKHADNWNEQTFTSIYVPKFMKEMLDLQACSSLDYLYAQDKMDKKICLVCFCTDEKLCHRSIIAGLLQGSGCNVVTDTGTDYSEYYQMWERLQNERG